MGNLQYEYNINDRRDIYRHSKELENKVVGDVYQLELNGKKRENLLDYYQEKNITGYIREDGTEKKGDKGRIGFLVQEVYFGIPRDNRRESDITTSKVELKVSPLERIKKGLSVKERLVLTMINRNEELPTLFSKSHVFNKCNLIMLIYYIDETKNNINPFSFPFYKSYYFQIPEEDLPQIEKDYEYIRDCVNQGRYEDLHEHNTKYLSPCSKNGNRSFSYKVSYMNQIFRDYISKDILLYDPYKDKRYGVVKKEFESLMSSQDYKENRTLEDVIYEKTKDYIGMTMTQIRRITMTDDSFSKWVEKKSNKIMDKSDLSRTTFLMLGIKGENSDELVKSNIYVKTLCVNEDKTMNEDISFPGFEFMTLVQEDWESSQCYSDMVDREFFWSVFQRNKNGDLIFRGVKFWSIPDSDEKTIRQGWEDIKEIVKQGVRFEFDVDGDGNYILTSRGRNRILNSFPDSKNTDPKRKEYRICPSPKPLNEIISIRPHRSQVYYDLKNNLQYKDTESSETNGSVLPNGDIMTQQCFWYNKEYILKQIGDLLI